MTRLPARLAALALLVGVTCTACGGAQTVRFPLANPMWVDPDRRPYAPAPEEQYTSWAWDAADSTVFRPLAEAWEYEESRPAINVNAVDEVPDSSWFENRLGLRSLSPARVAEGACAGRAPAQPPYTVVGPKPSGTGPGVLVRDARGDEYLLKVDWRQPQRATAADAIATRVFWAAGYHTPCNRVIAFTPEQLVLDDDATRAQDVEAPMTREDLQGLFEEAYRYEDGRLRGSLSLFLSPEPLGGWRFSGTRDDDPNDVVPHEHRRDVRGMYVLSAWLNHIDSRAENNYDGWVTVGDGPEGYVRHYVLDAGDSFGAIWQVHDAMTRRFGASHYVDLGHMVEDLVTFGALDRPWYQRADDEPHPVFGFFGTEHFDPDDWHTGYPNPAFGRRTEHDAAWMARIVAQFTDAHLEALVDTGQLDDPALRARLLRTLEGRRRAILQRYLTRLSPLSFPTVRPFAGAPSLCLRDLAVETGVRDKARRGHRVRALTAWPDPEALVPLAPRWRRTGAGQRVCVTLPSAPQASAQTPVYLVVEAIAHSAEHRPTGAAQVHLYQTGPETYRIVGLRRLEP